MTFCEDVANCIESSEDVESALTEWNTIHGSNGGIGNVDKVLPESIRQENLLPEDFQCDKTVIFRFTESSAEVRVL